MNDELAAILFLGVIAFFAFFLLIIPGIIASKRKHSYAGIIWVLAFLGSINGVTWVVAMIWAIWPQEKSLADPVLGNVTGTGSRNTGDVLGAVAVGVSDGKSSENDLRSRLKEAKQLLDEGVISPEEFQRKRESLLNI